MATRAPKQWQLTKHETKTSFEAWKQNLQYTLSLDPNFATFLLDGVTWPWGRKTTAARSVTSYVTYRDFKLRNNFC